MSAVGSLPSVFTQLLLLKMKGILLLVAVTAVVAVHLAASKPARAAAKEETIEYIQFINQPEAAYVAVKREAAVFSGDKGDHEHGDKGGYHEHAKLKAKVPAEVPGSGIDENNTSDKGEFEENPGE